MAVLRLGALSYTTLVSLPFRSAVIAFGTLSTFRSSRRCSERLVALAFRTPRPSIGEQAAWWFAPFEFGGPNHTIRDLATGILLLVTVEDQLNLICK